MQRLETGFDTISTLLWCPDLWIVLPYLDLVTVHIHRLDHEVHANGGSLSGREESLSESTHQAGLAHSGVSHQDDLEQEFVVFHLMKFL